MAQAQEGSRQSHWGEFPARVEADSLLLRKQGRERAAWEWPLYVPYRVARWPFSMLMHGAEWSVTTLEESGTIARVRSLLGGRDLPYGFRVSGVGNRLAGAGIGADFYHNRFLFEDTRFQLKTQWTIHGQARAIIGVSLPQRKWGQVDWVAGYRKRPRARYFMLGSELESYYVQEIGWTGLESTHPLAAGVALQARAIYSQIANRGARVHHGLSTDDPAAYGNRLPIGFGEQSRGSELSLGLFRDTTHQTARPLQGGLQKIAAGWFLPDSDEAEILTLRAEAQQFWPLWLRRALALRLVGAWQSSDGAPHFARLYSNDDPDQMRGYDDFRFRGRGMLLWNLEYRYPVWAYREATGSGIDFYLFQDGGQFFDDPEDLRIRSLVFSHGFGMRFVGSRGFGARAEIGFGDDEFVLRVSTDQVFQFARNGLYHGRSPIPLR